MKGEKEIQKRTVNGMEIKECEELKHFRSREYLHQGRGKEKGLGKKYNGDGEVITG